MGILVLLGYFLQSDGDVTTGCVCLVLRSDFTIWHKKPLPGRGVSEKVSAVGFCLGSGLFGSCNSD